MPSSHSFLSGSSVAVFGVSPGRKTFASGIYEALEKAGIKAYRVNPSGDTGFYNDLDSLPESAEAVYIATNSQNADKIADLAIAYGAKKIWFQFGSYNKSLIAKCKDAGMEIHTGCLMMYIPDVGLMHRVHRFFHELFAGKP